LSHRAIRYSFILLVGLATSCDRLPWNSEERKPLARVQDAFLYADEVSEILPSGLRGADSLDWFRQYTDQWVRNRVLIDRAVFNLGDEVTGIDELVERYREDLLKYRYQEAMLQKLLDTAITELQILDYFEANSANFELKENIVRAAYLVTVPEAPDLKEAKKMLQSGTREDLVRLEDYCLKYASGFGLSDSTWMSFSELSRKVPIQTYNQQQFLKKNSFVEIADSTRIHLLKIFEYRIKDGLSPLPYVRTTIRSILLNQRRRDILERLERDLLEEALEKKDCELYE
jgi:hypothetical protein